MKHDAAQEAHKKLPPSTAQHHPSAQTEIDDAMLLLTHAVKVGLNVDQTEVSSLIGIEEKITAGTDLDPTEEAAFWVIYAKLCSLAKPVTVESLKAITEIPDRWFGASLARRAIRRYTTLTAITFLLLVAAQIYWLIGHDITQSIDQTQYQLASYVAQLYGFKTGENLTGSNDNTARMAAEAPFKSQPDVSKATESPNEQTGSSESLVAPTPTPSEMFQLRQRFYDHVAILAGYYVTLRGWTHVWRYLITPWRMSVEEQEQDEKLLFRTETVPGAKSEGGPEEVRLVGLTAAGQLS